MNEKTRRICHDIEVAENFFCDGYIDFAQDSDFEEIFEISSRRNDLDKLVFFYKNEVEYAIGFNSLGYDDIVINFLIQEYSRLRQLSVSEICHEIKYISDLIIYDNNNEFSANYDKYKKYRWNKPFGTVDIFMFWSKMIRKSKKISLKGLAIAIKWPRIQELPYNPNELLKEEDFDTTEDYNRNDFRITKAVARMMLEDIKLRQAAKRMYGFDCMSWDEVKLGLNVILHRYCKRTNQVMKDIQERRSFRSSIALKDIILPIIEFKKGDISRRFTVIEREQVIQFKSFYGLLEYLKETTVATTKDLNCQVFVGNRRYDVKSGGLHTYHPPEVVIPPKGWIYEDNDVASYYPSLGVEYNIIPEHLGVEAAEELGEIKKDRMTLKKNGQGKGTEAELLKKAMNGGYFGNLNSEYTAMYDPKALLKITINGQLALLMLCEWLIEIGVTIDSCNTDGVTIMYPEELKEKVNETLRRWEKFIKMELETVQFDKTIRSNVNNYMVIHTVDGKQKLKQKGAFLSEKHPVTLEELSRSHDFEVIPKAITAYFKDGIPVDKFITEHRDIYDFCASKKVGRQYKVFWNGKQQQRLNRYYVSKEGAYLYKQKPTGKSMENLLKGFAVQIFNDYEEKPFEDYRIDYRYYIAEARAIVHSFESGQQKMELV